jgi:phenylacetate-CoA ligase
MGRLETAYKYCPVWIQNLGISAYGWFWRQERLGGRFHEFEQQFAARDRMDAARFHGYVNGELQSILTMAFREAPYYRENWAKAGLTLAQLEQTKASDLTHIPITAKQDLRNNPDAFVLESAAGKKAHRYLSSGSTGTPITAICTPEDHQRFMAAREVRSFRWAGTSIGDPRSMIGGRMVVPKGIANPPFHRYNWAERQVYFSAYHISPKSVPAYVAAMNRYQPALFTGYANSHYLMARMMSEQGIRLNYEPKALVLSSEKLTRKMKDMIRMAFRARAFEEYGSVENCVLATECEHGSLHVNPDFGIIEIVDPEGHPVEPGVPGRVLATGLLNHTQPLIRYEIGDVAAWSSKKCACGRDHLPVIEEVVGRLEDVVIGPDRREMVRFHGIFIDLPHVLEGQVIQEELDRFTVKVVAPDGITPKEEETIRARFEQRLGKVRVNIEQVGAIPRTERGKFRAVISHVARS